MTAIDLVLRRGFTNQRRRAAALSPIAGNLIQKKEEKNSALRSAVIKHVRFSGNA